MLIKGQTGEVASLFRMFLAHYPGWRGPAILGLVVVLTPIFTWKLLTDSLVPGLTGRKWLADGAVYAQHHDPDASDLRGALDGPNTCDRLDRLVPCLIWSMAVLVFVKLAVSVSRFRFALRRGLLSSRSVVRLAVLWAVVAIALMVAHLAGPARDGVSSSTPGHARVIALPAASRPVCPGAPGAGLEPASVRARDRAGRHQGLDSLSFHLYVASGGTPPGGENDARIDNQPAPGDEAGRDRRGRWRPGRRSWPRLGPGLAAGGQ